ncbi:MAG TPA: tripartite tricarboxylate transporter substrate binding protein [Negativicutes bacterium]|nr:tripartite tricarboxylate transporter substrate binding protein [Negativicutes bacterium]
MKARKLFCLGITVILAVSLVLVGCGGAGKDAKDTKKESPKYPTKAITLVCQFAAGGSTDLLARALGNSASKILGQPVVVENKVGASGTIGTDYVLKSKPDGYTLLTTSTGNFTSTPLVQNVPYDPNKDVRHIINIATHQIILVVHADSPWKTLDEFVAYVKQNPGKVKYGQNSPGGTTHMAMESFRKAAGLDMKMVPFGGGASEVVAALLGKHVDVGVMHPQEAGEHAINGTLRTLTVFAEKRIKTMPDVPTAKEKGFNVVMGVTKGISAPAGLPDDIALKLHDTFKKVMEDPDFKAAAKKTGDFDYLEYMSGDDTAKFLQNMYKEMAPLIKELGLDKKKK